MTKVNCTVESCIYWGQGDLCQADTIWVKGKMASGGSMSMEIGEELDGASQRCPETSKETCCETMRKKKDTGNC